MGAGGVEPSIGDETVHRYDFEIERDRLAEEARRQAGENAQRETLNRDDAHRRWETNEAAFKRDLRRVARYVGEMPFGAVFSITIKFIIAFWLANLVIAGVIFVVLAALGTQLAQLGAG